MELYSAKKIKNLQNYKLCIDMHCYMDELRNISMSKKKQNIHEKYKVYVNVILLLNSIINRSSRIHKTNVWGYQPK